MYAFLNTKWGDPTFGTPSGTINWDADISGLTPSGTTVNGLVNQLNNAFDRWEEVSAVNFAEGGSIDLNVTFGSFSADSDPTNDGAAAVYSYSVLPGSLVPQNATITFNSDAPWDPTSFFAVALHEIGHALGLAHPSELDINPGEIMNPVVRTNDLGNGDIAGAQIIYGTDGDDVPVDTGDGLGAAAGGGGGGGGGAGIGLLAGLLALLVGLFSGGAGAVAMAAAARVADDDDDAAEPVEHTVHGAGCGCAACCAHDGHVHDNGHVHTYETLADGTIQVAVVTPMPELPMVDFDYASFDDGEGDAAETEDDFLLT